MSEIFQSLLSIYFQTIAKNFYQNKKASPVFSTAWDALQML